MKFIINRDEIFEPLKIVSGVVERQQTLPILSNVLFSMEADHLSLMTSDSQVQIVSRATPLTIETPGSITIPARKLFDIIKSLPEAVEVEVLVDNGKATFKSDSSHFTLNTLSADDFPSMVIDTENLTHKVSIQQKQLKRLIETTSFAMGERDARFFLNGTLFEISKDKLQLVATDGHRLSIAFEKAETSIADADITKQSIVPRKAVLELYRLLEFNDEVVDLLFNDDLCSISTEDFVFTTRLLESEYPNYQQVLPSEEEANFVVDIDRGQLRQALQRVVILSNIKFPGASFHFENEQLTITANNPEQESAQEKVAVSYSGEVIPDIAFNISYLQDILSIFEDQRTKVKIAHSSKVTLLEELKGSNYYCILMPMRV